MSKNKKTTSDEIASLASKVLSDKNSSQLEKYLMDSDNSHAKESLLNNKILFDLKLAAAERGYFLNFYTPEVDKDGFDIILDDQDSLTKIQLKTVMKNAGTTSWDIHKSLLRPEFSCCEQIGFEASPTGSGYQGGIVLLEIKLGDGFEVDYFYTDTIILLGIKHKIINLAKPPTEAAINKLFSGLIKGPSHEKIAVNKNMFIKAKNPACLLALIGLHNNENTSIWRYHIQTMVPPCDCDSLAAPYEKLKEHVNNEILSISNDCIKTS
jgi:hypothetical protein